MDKINTLSWFDKLEQKLINVAQQRIASNASHVEWISYHIPKTAGTSFRVALQQAFGPKHFYAVYEQSSPHELTNGNAIWLPADTQVIHGHFRPHKAHKDIFPKAKRIIWLRDPIKRAWSLLNHTLDVKNNNKVFNYLDHNFLSKGIDSREELFIEVIKDKRSRQFFNVYERDFKRFSHRFFEFVGATENYQQDLQRLAEKMQKPLTVETLNPSRNKTPAPQLTEQQIRYFDVEYEIYERLFNGK